MYSIHFSIPHPLTHTGTPSTESSSHMTTNKYHSCKHSLNTLLLLLTQVLMSVRELKNLHRHNIRTSVWKVSARNHTIRCRASQKARDIRMSMKKLECVVPSVDACAKVIALH